MAGSPAVLDTKAPPATGTAKRKHYRPGSTTFLATAGITVFVTLLLLVAAGDANGSWTIARAYGFATFGFLTASVAVGTFLTLGWRKYRDVWLVAERLHPNLILAAGALGIGHIAGLLLVDFPVVGTFIPFTSSYRGLWVGLGTLSLYLAALIVWSTYIMRYIGFRVWRSLHYGAFIVWALALLHGLGAGHDSGDLLARGYYVAGAVVVGLLVLAQLVHGVLSLRRPAPALETSKAS
jgi:sulfoxide reductase heme-binding subunit YedZ